MRVIAAINQKGGVGKTTTVANLGAALAQRGLKICLVDLDPQSHLTLHLDIEPGSAEFSTYDLLTHDVAVDKTVRSVQDNLWLLPAEIDLAAAETELAETPGREQILRQRLRCDDLPFDHVLIDCPPSLGLLTLNALSAADDVMIPLQPHFLALQGLGKLLETISLVQHRINPSLRVGAVVLCMYEQVTRLAGEVVDDLKTFFEAARGTECPWSETRIFESVIRRNIKLAECPSHGKTIFQYEPSSHGATDYGALADEFLTWLADTRPQPPAEPAAEAPKEIVDQPEVLSSPASIDPPAPTEP